LISFPFFFIDSLEACKSLTTLQPALSIREGLSVSIDGINKFLAHQLQSFREIQIKSRHIAMAILNQNWQTSFFSMSGAGFRL